MCSLKLEEKPLLRLFGTPLLPCTNSLGFSAVWSVAVGSRFFQSAPAAELRGWVSPCCAELSGRWEPCQALSFPPGMPTAWCSYVSAVIKTVLWVFSCSVPRLGAFKSILQVLLWSSVTVTVLKRMQRYFRILSFFLSNVLPIYVSN